MKALLVSIVIVLISINSVAYQNEPDGFREIKWGTDISSLKNMIRVRTDPSYGGVEWHKRKGDELQIGDAKIESIEYGFWRGKFTIVWITINGEVNWSGLKEATFAKFGPGFQSNVYIERYKWTSGSITNIMLEYDKISDVGRLGMSSKEIGKQQEDYSKQKAKEGAETGF